MKKFKVLTLILFVFFVSKPLVNAACTTEEDSKLYKEASNVKASYEILEKDIGKEPDNNPPDGLTPEEYENFTWMQDYFRIYITNITENLYVKVTNDITEEELTFTYNDAKDGTISFDQDEILTIRNYTITVYTSANTNCQDKELYKTYVTTPMYNSYHDETACDGLENFYLCNEWLSVNIVGVENIYDRIERYKKGQIDEKGEEITEKKEEEKGFKKFLNEHKSVIIATSICIIAAGGLVTVIIVKKQRSKRI